MMRNPFSLAPYTISPGTFVAVLLLVLAIFVGAVEGLTL